MGIFTLGIGIAMLAMHIGQAVDTDARRQTREEDTRISLAVAEQYMLAAEYDEAMLVLTDLQATDPNNNEVRTAVARCSLLSGNYAAAVQMYEMVEGVGAEEKAAATALYDVGQNSNNSLITYLKGEGVDPGKYNLKATEVKVGDYEATKALVLEAIGNHLDEYEENESYDVVEAAEAAAKITAAFKRYTGSSITNVAEEDLALAEDMEAVLEEAPELQRNPHLRIARMKAFVLTGDYEKIAETANRDVSTQELIVLAELYTNGLVDPDDFSEAYTDVTERSDEIVEQCGEILESIGDSLPDYQREKYEEKIERLQQQMEDPVEFTLRKDLTDAAKDGALALRSKSYLALSKIEKYNGNDDAANGYLADALGTAGESNDENYRVPMNQLAGIVQDTVDSEEIKKVAEYVDQALDHSLPLGVEANQIVVPETEAGDSEEPAESEREEFSGFMGDSICTKTAVVNIGSISKDEFPKVVARVQVQSDEWKTIEELREHIKVYDCGAEITDFELTKIEYQKSRIVLLCDVSGSMAGSVKDLKNAITSFAEKMTDGEEVSVIGFDSDIVFIKDFSGDPEVVKTYADSISALGGTAIYSALIKTIEQFPENVSYNNIIITMTDGQDGKKGTEAELHNTLGANAAMKAITVYTLGLGSGVETEYLKEMASCGNGSFLYVDSQEKLETFYNFIHGQLANQYLLTYTAKNTTKNERRLEITMDGELGSASKTYYLVDKIYTDEGSESYDAYVPQDAELTVHGLSAKFMYKSSEDQTILLRGSGFDEGDPITVRLLGNVNYPLTTKFIDANTYEVVIPSIIGTGSYDLDVAVRGENFVLEDEFSVAIQTTKKQFPFGSYNFTALSSYVNERGETVLSGNVTLNGWLHFKGDVTIDPGYEGSGRAWITDNSGSYIEYSTAASMGLAKKLAEEGMPIPLLPLGKFSVCSDLYTPGEYEDFPTYPVSAHIALDMDLFEVETGEVTLYPDMIRITALDFDYGFSLKDQLLRGLKMTDFEVEVTADIMLTATQVGFVGSAKYSSNDNAPGFTFISLPLTIEGAEVKIDTLENTLNLEGTVKFKALGKSSGGLTLGVGVKNFKLDSIKLQALGSNLPIITTPIPISMSNFGFALENLSTKAPDDGMLEWLLTRKISFLFSVDVASLNTYAPDIAKLIDDEESVALAKLDNCNLSLELAEFRLSFDADIVFCNIIDVGKCSVKLGKFDYTNALIGYYNETQYGLQIAVTRNLIDWDTDNLTMKLTGTTELTLGYPYTGLWFNGSADFDVKYWIFKTGFDVSGDALIGCYKNSTDNFQFSVIVRGQGPRGGYTGFHLHITKARGLCIDTY